MALTISPIIDAIGPHDRACRRSCATSANARQAEAALARARELERKLSAGLEQLTRASMAVSNAVAELPKTSLTAVLDTIAVQAQLLTGADYVALGVGTDPEKPFDTWVSVGMTEAQARAIGRHPRPVGVLGAVSREGEVVRIRDIREHRGVSRAFPRSIRRWRRSWRFRSAIAIARSAICTWPGGRAARSSRPRTNA